MTESHPSGRSILIVTRNLPPLIGGMERLIWHVVDSLRTSHSVEVVGPTGCGAHLPSGVTAVEVPLAPLSRFLVAGAWSAITRALSNRPRIVLAGSGLTAPMAWLAARLCGARCVAYLHGLDIVVDQPVYRMLWRPLFRHLDHVIVNSQYTRTLALNAGVRAERISILHPGVELPDLSAAVSRRHAFRSRHALGDGPLMLYVGRINARKGLSVFVRDILPTILESVPEVRLVVVGDEPRNALTGAGGEQARVQKALRETGLLAAVSFLGPQDDDALSDAYFSADVMVFPVQDVPGDIEGFGMVAIEAAAHDLPTVAFAVGGVPDAVSEGISGSLIPPKSNQEFALAVIDSLQSGKPSNCHGFAESFTWRAFSRRLHTLLGLANGDI
jgi:phosphatidylinositol alpha-1,6-mannosyltransferase